MAKEIGISLRITQVALLFVLLLLMPSPVLAQEVTSCIEQDTPPDGSLYGVVDPSEALGCSAIETEGIFKRRRFAFTEKKMSPDGRETLVTREADWVAVNRFRNSAHPVRKAAAGIGRLARRIQGPYGNYYADWCTAWRIGDNHVITNYHCVPGKLEHTDAGYEVKNAQVRFNYLNQGSDAGTVVIPLSLELTDENFSHNHALDYVILKANTQIPASIADLSRYDIAEVEADDALWVIQHPYSLPLKLARDCFVVSIGEDTFEYDCHTLSGSSGSPVFAEKDGQLKIVGLHRGRISTSTNRASKIEKVAEDSSVFRKLLRLNMDKPEKILVDKNVQSEIEKEARDYRKEAMTEGHEAASIIYREEDSRRILAQVVYDDYDLGTRLIAGNDPYFFDLDLGSYGIRPKPDGGLEAISWQYFPYRNESYRYIGSPQRVKEEGSYSYEYGDSVSHDVGEAVYIVNERGYMIVLKLIAMDWPDYPGGKIKMTLQYEIFKESVVRPKAN